MRKNAAPLVRRVVLHLSVSKVFISATRIKMFWLLVGIILGIWLDQSFTIPHVQDFVDYVSKEYKKRIEVSKSV